VLEDPEILVNIGTVIRNISAFGVTKLYVVGKQEVLKDFETSRKDKHLLKMSVGASKWVFVKRFDTAEECIAHLRKDLYTIAITSSHEKGLNNIDLYEGEFTQKRLAVWFGNESHGVSDVAIKNADMCIRIPMGGVVESLNLGTSTGIILGFISYQRLKFVFEHKKAKIKPASKVSQLMKSWRDFIDPVRE
jgi:tRNA (guanosine-2'-O-)-methyltransferase